MRKWGNVAQYLSNVVILEKKKWKKWKSKRKIKASNEEERNAIICQSIFDDKIKI